MWRMVGAVVVMALMPVAASAQALVERVPADAVLYVGWAGARELADAYEGTHTQGIVEASQLKGVFEQTWPAIKARVTAQEPEAAEVMESAERLVRVAWQHPVAVFVTDPRPERPRGGTLVDAGGEAGAIEQLVRQMTADAPNSMNVRVFREGGIVGYTFGYPEGEVPVAGAGEGAKASIATNARFNAAMSQVQKSPALIVYSDVAAFASSVRTFAPPAGDGTPFQIAGNLLEGVNAVTWTGGFEGKQWATQTFVAAPAPRQGMATLLESQPVSESLLKAVPRSTDWLAVRRLDLAKLFNETRSALEKANPELARMFDMGVGGATLALGGNLQDTLLNPLGDEWAVYTAPPVTGVGLLGGVVLNRVDDAAKVNRGLSNLALLITNSISGQLPKGANRQPAMRLMLQQHTHNGTRISYINSPLITPSWAIKDDILYMGLYPQTVAGALDAAGAEGGSILDKPEFQAVRKQLPEAAATSISFVDLPQTAEQSYASLLMMAQLYMGGADLFSGEGQPLLLPPMARLKPHLTPSGRVAWVDEAGWHARTIGPFPMHDMFAGEFSAVGSQYSTLVAVLVPSLMRAQSVGRANAVTLMNMRQIAIALNQYMNDNDNRLPPDLGALVRGGYVAPQQVEVFVEAHRRGMIPPDLDRADAEAVAGWINANTSYVYVRPAERVIELRQPATTILVHERIEGLPDDARIACAFADAHAEHLTAGEVRRRLATSQTR